MNIKSVMLVLAAAVLPAFADETEAGSAAPVAKAPAKASFSTLPCCRRAEGQAEVRKPGGEWTDVREGKFYPLGSSFRTGRDGLFVLSFGEDATMTLSADSEVGTRVQKLGEMSRTAVLVRGTTSLDLADNMPEGAFSVVAPGFVVKNLAGKSRYVYEDKGDGDKVTIRCVTGVLSIDGRHFSVPAMRSADELVIRTSRDHLSTFLNGTSGDYVVRLDLGLKTKREIGDDGQVKQETEKNQTDWHLSPKMKIVIDRMVPAIGERLSVHTMVFDAAGELQGDGVSFSEGRAEINFGEIGSKDKATGEELAKRAAEADETTETSEEDESADSQKKSEDNASEKEE